MPEDSFFSSQAFGSRDPVDVTPPPRPSDDRGKPRSSAKRRIALGLVAVVGLAALSVGGVFGARILSQKDATLGTPDRVAGLTRDTSEGALGTADDLRSAFAAGIDLDASVGAVYKDAASAEHSVLFFGGTTLLWSPEKDLDTLFGLVTDGDGAVRGLHRVPEGALGGVMKCGTTTTEGEQIAVCGWADHGSVGIGLFPGRTVDDAAKLFGEIRPAVETR
jgi:hypothetical protein